MPDRTRLEDSFHGYLEQEEGKILCSLCDSLLCWQRFKLRSPQPAVIDTAVPPTARRSDSDAGLVLGFSVGFGTAENELP